MATYEKAINIANPDEATNALYQYMGEFLVREKAFETDGYHEFEMDFPLYNSSVDAKVTVDTLYVDFNVEVDSSQGKYFVDYGVTLDKRTDLEYDSDGVQEVDFDEETVAGAWTVQLVNEMFLEALLTDLQDAVYTIKNSGQ